MEQIMVFNHPLIQHKISILRNKSTGTNEFRALIEEIGHAYGIRGFKRSSFRGC